MLQGHTTESSRRGVEQDDRQRTVHQQGALGDPREARERNAREEKVRDSKERSDELGMRINSVCYEDL